ncbi:MAG: hypothetical protein M3Y59_17600, partial [Myxococcota bacterium]|nr:hypothetical protein [Myxococcota bacterium]
AERARKAAEEAQRKAAEAAERAAAAAKAAEKAKADPKTDPKALAVEEKKAATAKTAAESSQANADKLTEVAKTAAEAAKVKMTKANELATAQKTKPPFTNEAISSLTRQDVFEKGGTESLPEKAAKIPAEVQKRLGLTDEDVAAIKDEAVPHLKAAADQLLAGKPAEAIASLQEAAKAGAGEAAERAIVRAAEKLPDTGVAGVARELLTDPKVVHDLVSNPEAQGAISKLAQGDLGGALKDLAALPSIQDNVIQQLKDSPAVKGALSKIGLEPDDLDKAKDAIPSLIEAGQLAATGDFKGAIEKLGEAAQTPGAREILTEAITDTAAKLKTTGAEGMARSLLTDSDFVEGLLSSPEAGEALSLLAAGKATEAIQALSSDTELMESAISALAENPDFKKGMEKLGLTEAGLLKAADALPDLLKAVDSAAKGNVQEAIGFLADAGAKAPEAVAELINKAAKNLPDGPAKALLSDKKFVEELFKNPDTASAIKDLASGKVQEGLKKLAGNEAAATAAVDALFKDPSFKAGAEKLGLTAESLKKGVDALPQLLDAAVAANKGDYQAAIGHLADAAQKAPEVAADLITNAAKKLPEGPAKALLSDRAFVESLVGDPATAGAIKDFASGKVEDGLKKLAGNEAASTAAVDALFKDPSFKAGAEKLGITPESLKKGVDALPDLVEAGIAANKGDFKAALGHLADAAVKAPEVVTDIVTTAAKRLPEGPAKALLSDRAFVEKLVSNPETAAAIKDFADGKVGDGLKKLAGNEEAAKAAVDALAKDPKFKSAMEKLGLTAESIKKGVDALPDLVDAISAAGAGDLPKAIGHLADAAQKAPEVVAEAINTAAKKLPDGPAKALLSDRAFVESLVGNPATAGAIKDFAAGNVTEGLKKLAQNPEAAKAAVDALYKDPTVKAGFEKLGITPEQLKAGVDALPSLVEAGIAASKGDITGAVGHLADAAQKAPELVAAAINKAAQSLPPGMTRDLLTDKDFVATLAADPKATQAIKDFARGDLASGLKNLGQSEAVATAAIDVLAKNPDFKKGIEKLGLTPEDLKAGVDALPDLVDAGLKAARGDFTGALKSMVDAAKKAPEVVSAAIAKAAENLPDTGAGGLLKSVLNDPAAVQALLTDSKLHGGLKKLIDGDLSGLKDIGTSPAMGPVVEALAKNPDIKKGLEQFGLTVADLKSGARALPDLIKGVQALGQGDFQTAFSSLKDAALNMPPSIVEKAIKTGAAHLPDALPGSLLKSLLTDDKFVHELVTNPDLHDSFKQAMSGDLTGAVEGILGNEAFAGAASEALARNTELMAKLEKVGITSAADLKDAGKALVDLLQAGQKLADGDLGGALAELGEGFGNLPADMKSRLIGKFADAVNLPDGARDVLVAAAGVLGDPTVRANLGDAFKKLKDGDIGGFVSGIAGAGRHLMATNREAALAMVNSLKHLPGTLGKFFDDEQFNAAMVDSGAAEEMFSAVEKMANGDISGALGDIMQAGGKLLTQEPHFEIAGQELPIGMQGLENMARLAKNFFDVLPASLKEKIAEQAGKAAGKSLIKSIPIIGNVFSGISAIGSGKDLIDALGKDPKDWVDVGLNAAQLGLDIAGTIPGLGNALTGTLGNIVGMGKVVYGAANLIGDMKSFQEDFVGFGG